MKNISRLRAKGLKGVFALLGLLVAFSAAASAQVEKNTDYSPDKSLKSNARVNPSTLAMELSIPISGYAGRAGNGMPVAFNYSSKVWEMKHSGIWESSLLGTKTSVMPTFAKRTAAGWTSSLGTPRINFRFDRYRDQDQSLNDSYEGMTYSPAPWQENPNNPFLLYYMKRVIVQMPDGSSHEFRASDLPVYCGTNVNDCTNVDQFDTYLSVDGSKMRLEVAEDESTLYLPDGSRYVFGTYSGSTTYADVIPPTPAHTFIDRHGNQMTYDIEDREWTDTMGRILADPFPMNWLQQEQVAGPGEARFPGYGTGELEYEFTWSYLKDPVGSDHALDDPNDEPHNLSDKFCQGNLEHATTGPDLFANLELNTRICGPGYTTQGPAFNPVVLTKIELPNGQSYQFRYNVYGEIVRIIYPTGAYERFEYQQLAPLQAGSPVHDKANRGVSDRWVSESGTGIDEVHWEYDATRGTILNPAPYIVTITAPDGTYTQQYIHDDPNTDTHRPFGLSDARIGRSYEDRVYSSTDVLMRRNLTKWEETEVASGINPSTSGIKATRDLRPVKSISIIFEPGESNALVSLSETVYDTTGNSDPAYFSSLNPKQTKTYDYVVVNASTAASANLATAEGWFASATPSVVTEMDYLYDASYVERNITGLVTESRVKDAVGNVKAKTQISYDDSAHTESSSGTMPTAAANSWIDPLAELGSTIGAKRGLLTVVKSYYDIPNGYYIQTESFYDQYGNLRKSKDGRGSDTWTAYDADYAFAYPTSSTSPIPDLTGVYGSNSALATSTAYDYNTGLPLTVTDANVAETEMEYVDALLRPTKTIAPNGQQTITEYGAGTSASTRWIKVKTQIDETNWKEGISWFDGLGRTYRSQSLDAEAGDVLVETEYDDMGRPKKATNPYRTGDTIYWTETYYDDLGRAVKMKTPDNAEAETFYGLATSGSVIGTSVTVEDQAGKLRRSVTNARGQLKRVDEPNDSNQLGAIDSPNQWTGYTYDLLNNLITVNQGVQTRTFSYDSLSRLLSAANPESGTISYGYDPNGNLLHKTDARGVRTDHVYDALNRVTNRNYSLTGSTPPNYQASPDVTYYYDNLMNAKGKLIKVQSSVSATEYTSFDILGRVTGHKQTTNGVSYTTGYAYNLSGAMIEQVYPSGRVVKNVLDDNGDLSLVQGAKCMDAVPATNADCTSQAGLWNYAQNFSYNAAGAVTSMQLGNFRWESTQFNSRLQPVQIALGATQNATSLLKLDYTYNTTGNADNNGNVLSQTITVPSVDTHTGFSAVQTYSYDSLNRIKGAAEDLTPDGGTATQSWKQAFTYDRYGNRNFDEQETTTLPKACLDGVDPVVCAADKKIVNPSVNASNNRLSTSDGYIFDNAGNTTKDAESRKFTYDAENKQVKVEALDTTGNPIATIGEYSYDGDGKRVKKHVPSTGETTVFVYDASGKLVAEYSTTTPPTTPQIAYLTNDHLGSPRINTDQNGNITARHDYQPFGEEIFTSERTAGLGYAADTIRRQFTGYERDNEVNLDFAQARYYNNQHGRFTTTDPIIMRPERLSDPQQINLYVYVRNSPTMFTDPTGEDLNGRTDGRDDLTEEDRRRLERQLRRLAPGTRVNADGTVRRPGFWQRVANRLSGHGVGTELVSNLVRSERTTTVVVGTGQDSGTGGNVTDIQNGTRTDAEVYWNYNQTSPPGAITVRTQDAAYTANGPTTSETNPDPAIVLGHELIHASHIVAGTASFDRTAIHDFVIRSGNTYESYQESNPRHFPREEFRTVGFHPYAQRREVTENRLRRELNRPLRVAYYHPRNWVCTSCGP